MSRKTYADIVLLLRNGYTREEIESMPDADEAPAGAPRNITPAPTPAAQEVTTQADAEPVKADAEPVKADAEPVKAPASDDLTAAVRDLIATMQANNRAAAEMGDYIVDPQTDAVNTLRGYAGIPTPSK